MATHPAFHSKIYRLYAQETARAGPIAAAKKIRERFSPAVYREVILELPLKELDAEASSYGSSTDLTDGHPDVFNLNKPISDTLKEIMETKSGKYGPHEDQ